LLESVATRIGRTTSVPPIIWKASITKWRILESGSVDNGFSASMAAFPIRPRAKIDS